MSNLKKFLDRGMAAQQAVNEATEQLIAKSEDVAWLRQVMTNADAALSLRTAAQARLRKIQRGRMGR